MLQKKTAIQKSEWIWFDLLFELFKKVKTPIGKKVIALITAKAIKNPTIC